MPAQGRWSRDGQTEDWGTLMYWTNPPSRAWPNPRPYRQRYSLPDSPRALPAECGERADYSIAWLYGCYGVADG